MSEQELIARLEAIQRDVAAQRKLLEGEPYDRDDQGLVGDMREVKQALWGPPGRPNGIVGTVKEIRVTTRTMIVGLIVTGVGVFVQQMLGG